MYSTTTRHYGSSSGVQSTTYSAKYVHTIEQILLLFCHCVFPIFLTVLNFRFIYFYVCIYMCTYMYIYMYIYVYTYFSIYIYIIHVYVYLRIPRTCKYLCCKVKVWTLKQGTCFKCLAPTNLFHKVQCNACTVYIPKAKRYHWFKATWDVFLHWEGGLGASNIIVSDTRSRGQPACHEDQKK
jgi:hypothetical protein